MLCVLNPFIPNPFRHLICALYILQPPFLHSFLITLKFVEIRKCVSFVIMKVKLKCIFLFTLPSPWIYLANKYMFTNISGLSNIIFGYNIMNLNVFHIFQTVVQKQFLSIVSITEYLFWTFFIGAMTCCKNLCVIR